MMSSRTQTVNIRNPIVTELPPPGTEMVSPHGLQCLMVGPSRERPGQVTVAVQGKWVHIWPALLKGFRVNGVTL